jgi:methionyl-tRNA synthetase
MSKPFYLTTTIPYINAPLHMGHALEFIRADAIARYKKLAGFDVYFNTGTDEHGKKNHDKAVEKGMTPQEFVDQAFKVFEEQLKMFGISEDVHITRTTDAHHKLAAQEFWKRVNDNGYLYKKSYQAKYCVGCESEKTDSELDEKGECPLHPGRPIELIDEENYFFKFSEFQDQLLKLYEKNPELVIPEFRLNEIKNFVKNGLQDFSISRVKSKMPWGVAVPGDEDHVMYVWFDALVNYISTLGWPDNLENFEKYWVNGTPTQYCGKDNLRFQSAIWQAMLIAVGLPNSSKIIIDGFITGDGGVRMSKTLGNVVDPRDIANEYGTDALRYFLLREISSFEDSPFTPERFKEAYNSGLANGLGNLSSRILTLSEKYLDKCPEISEKTDFTEYFEIYEEFDLKKVMDYIWEKIQGLDRRVQEEEPFKVIKVDEEKGKEMIKNLVLDLYQIARMLNPVMPETNVKLKKLIRDNKKPETALFLRKD